MFPAGIRAASAGVYLPARVPRLIMPISTGSGPEIFIDDLPEEKKLARLARGQPHTTILQLRGKVFR